ncbi:MAG: pyrroline-5-carboxylate reductase family protein [Syntrophothermus sp.]
MFKTVGFIGGGRVTRIILSEFKRKGLKFDKIVVSDISLENLEKLKAGFPDICIAHNDNIQPSEQQLVFISLHPPAIINLLKEINNEIKPESIIVSLAPKITIAKIRAELNGFSRIARMIPNAPSIIGAGFNPVSFSEGLLLREKEELDSVFSVLGFAPEVPEEKLEAYAILTAMGPTYFWFQLYELKSIAEDFGLTKEEAEEGIKSMMEGTLRTMFSDMTPQEVMDLVPVRPLGEDEEIIKGIFRSRLPQVFNRIRP